MENILIGSTLASFTVLLLSYFATSLKMGKASVIAMGTRKKRRGGSGGGSSCSSCSSCSGGSSCGGGD